MARYTVAKIDSMPDSAFEEVVSASMEAAAVMSKRADVPLLYRSRAVELRRCTYAQCGKVEEMAGDYACCGVCKKAPYCSQECMKLDWPTHKTRCKKKGGGKKNRGKK